MMFILCILFGLIALFFSIKLWFGSKNYNNTARPIHPLLVFDCICFQYLETFAPIACYTSIWTIKVVVVVKRWELNQINLKTSFLIEVIEEKDYIEQTEGFVIHSKDSSVCRLKRVFYGLKQAPCAWNEKIDHYLLGLGSCLKNDADPNLYFKVIDDKILILVLYINDLFLIGEDGLIIKCKELLLNLKLKTLVLFSNFLHLMYGIDPDLELGVIQVQVWSWFTSRFVQGLGWVPMPNSQNRPKQVHFIPYFLYFYHFLSSLMLFGQGKTVLALSGLSFASFN